MSQLCKRLDRVGVNCRLLILISSFAALLAAFEFPLFQTSFAYGIVRHWGATECDLKLLGQFPLDLRTATIDDIPLAIRQLDGQKVWMEGFVATPSGNSDRMREFAFVYNVRQSDWDAPTVQQKVFVKVPDGLVGDYPTNEIRVVGTFHVNIIRDAERAGTVVSVYTMDLDRIEPL